MSSLSSTAVPVAVPWRIDELELESSVGLVTDETSGPEIWGSGAGLDGGSLLDEALSGGDV